MIWVLSGTRDAVEIIKLLKEEGYEVMASAVTDYGTSLARGAGADEVVTKALDCSGMRDVIYKKSIDAVVDATHPFSVEASRNAMSACETAGIKYVRFERKPIRFDCPGIYQVKDFEEAARKACEIGNRERGNRNTGGTSGDTIFHAAGSRNVRVFVRYARANNMRLVARVLPEPYSIKACLDAGLSPADIIAALGPFSEQMNRAMLREYRASVLVTKESGVLGGVKAKVEAALALDIPVVMIERPRLDYIRVADDYDTVLRYL